MTAFRQLCPSCKRTLELPVTAMGQLAQCPACNERFAAGEQPATVDQSEPVSEIGPSETGIASGPSPSESQAESQGDLEVDLTRVGLPEDADTEPTEAAEQTADVTTPTRDPISLEPFSSHSADSTTTDPIGSEFGKPTPTEAEPGKPPTHHVPAGSFPEYPEGVNPFSVPLSQASPLPGLENPYLSPQPLSSGNFARRGEVIIVSRSISEILKTTWVLLLSRGIAQLASFLCISFVIAGMAVFAMICRGLLSPFVTDLGLDVTAFTIGTLACTIIIVASCRNSIAIVRNTPNLMAASMPTLRAIIHTLVLIVLLTVVASMFRWTLFGQYFVDSSVIILTGICTAVTCGWLWISIFLCGDMQSSGFGSLILALRILYHNKLTTALLILISSLLTICGVVSCGILLLVTQPITQMMLATAYLMMTNQKIADPRHPIETA